MFKISMIRHMTLLTLFLVPNAWSGEVISFPTEAPFQSGLNEVEVAPLLNVLTVLYSAKIKTAGYDLNWDYDWGKPYLGAGSFPQEQSFHIMLWGGFIRAPGMTKRSLALTLCHEIGHMLGGEPRMLPIPGGAPWASIEGQADQFAATECLPQLYQNIPTYFSEITDAKVVQFCDANKSSPLQCQQVVQAGLDFMLFSQRYFQLLGPIVNLTNQASETPAQTLFMSYPSDQCRLDTYKQGGLCINAESSSTQNCLRPRCWYSP